MWDLTIQRPKGAQCLHGHIDLDSGSDTIYNSPDHPLARYCLLWHTRPYGFFFDDRDNSRNPHTHSSKRVMLGRGPEDKVVCGNKTRTNSSFRAVAKRVVLEVVQAAPNSIGYYGRWKLDISRRVNESAYVLANCRALNTGCFMRYSDTDFLNKEQNNERSRAEFALTMPDGKEIAIKRLYFNNRHRAAYFYNEVNIISSVEHKNLMRLLGCRYSGLESLLVYEFLPNKSLDQFIFDRVKGRELNWEKRYDIIIGTAEGLVYLHENSKTRIIHRDIKASNILLDAKLRAKIADFGLARSFQEDKRGYMAPEYLAHGTAEELFDPNLVSDNNNVNKKDEILKVVHIGLLCTQENPSLRPTMSRALQMLTKKEENLARPSNQPFIDENTMDLRRIEQLMSSLCSCISL
ncbi:hypothetical protein AHAS_Ahas01G0159600 [Arachis hypogaea]